MKAYNSKLFSFSACLVLSLFSGAGVVSSMYICFFFVVSTIISPMYYVDEETLSGGSACKWYLNEDIPEINQFFDRLVKAPHNRVNNFLEFYPLSLTCRFPCLD